MSANTRYLAALWVFAGAVGLLAVFGAGTLIARGDAGSAAFVLFVAVAAGGLVAYWWWMRRRLRRLLQEESPEPLVAFYRRAMRSRLIPDAEALLAHACAFAYTLYADFSAARAALDEVSWDRRPPLIQASRLTVEAMLCYLDDRAYQQGLNLAATARDMAVVPGTFPGARVSAAAFESYVEIGEVLAGQATDATVAGLERKLTALPLMGKLIAAWGLEVAYRQRGNEPGAAAMREFIAGVAPHCQALRALSPTTPV